MVFNYNPKKISQNVRNKIFFSIIYFCVVKQNIYYAESIYEKN